MVINIVVSVRDCKVPKILVQYSVLSYSRIGANKRAGNIGLLLNNLKKQFQNKLPYMHGN